LGRRFLAGGFGGGGFCCGFLGGRFLGGFARLGGTVSLALAVFAHGGEAGLQRAHQVRRRGLLLLGFGLHGDLLALGLALDQREHVLAISVAVLAGLEV